MHRTPPNNATVLQSSQALNGQIIVHRSCTLFVSSHRDFVATAAAAAAISGFALLISRDPPSLGNAEFGAGPGGPFFTTVPLMLPGIVESLFGADLLGDPPVLSRVLRAIPLLMLVTGGSGRGRIALDGVWTELNRLTGEEP